VTTPDCQSRAARLWRASNRRTVGQGFARAARLSRRGIQGWKPLPGGHARNEAGILRDGFGVPSARSHRLRCITALFVVFSLRPLASPSRVPTRSHSARGRQWTMTRKVAVRANLRETQPLVSDILFLMEDRLRLVGVWQYTGWKQRSSVEAMDTLPLLPPPIAPGRKFETNVRAKSMTIPAAQKGSSSRSF